MLSHLKGNGAWVEQFCCDSMNAYVTHSVVFFNGPRAGANFNDGFGGGNEVESNLIFNMCRESTDHGPINSW